MQLLLQNWSLRPSDPAFAAEMKKLAGIIETMPEARLVRTGPGSAVVEVRDGSPSEERRSRSQLEKLVKSIGWKVYETSEYTLP